MLKTSKSTVVAPLQGRKRGRYDIQFHCAFADLFGRREIV